MLQNVKLFDNTDYELTTVSVNGMSKSYKLFDGIIIELSDTENLICFRAKPIADGDLILTGEISPAHCLKLKNLSQDSIDAINHKLGKLNNPVKFKKEISLGNANSFSLTYKNCRNIDLTDFLSILFEEIA